MSMNMFYMNLDPKSDAFLARLQAHDEISARRKAAMDALVNLRSFQAPKPPPIETRRPGK